MNPVKVVRTLPTAASALAWGSGETELQIE
jgi:hypothetical protein